MKTRAVASLLAVALTSAVLTPVAAQSAVGQTSGVVWAPCQPGSVEQCTTLTVPLDWSRPQGRTTQIFVARVPARDPARRIGTLAFNPGGPGAAGGSMFAYGAADQIFSQLRDRFDLVSFDPRGSGQSSHLDCGPVLTPGVPVFPANRAEYDAMVAASRRTGERCLAEHGSLLRNLDTRTTARDLDAIRAALGLDRISYLGVSFGSFLGATYAQMFPRRVHRMVLDGALDHAQGPVGLMLAEAAGMEDGFNRFAAWCDTDTTCALHGRNAGAVYDRVVRAADKAPLPAPGAGAGVTVTGDEIRMSLPTLLPMMKIVSNPWPRLAEALAQADAGDGSGFAGAGLVRSPETAYAAISCMDLPGRLRGYADARARLALARKVAPRTGAAVEAWAMAAACSGWPVAPTNPWAPTIVHGVPQILIASTTHDPATPVSGAISMAKQIRGSRLLLAEEYGHVAYFNSACARDRETEYLLTGKLPRPGYRCPAEQ